MNALLPMASARYHGLLGRDTAWLMTPDMAVRLTCSLWQIDPCDLLSRRRAASLVDARAMAVWMLRAVPAERYSYPDIARVLGGRDHAGVIHLHRRAIALRLTNPEFAAICASILEHFGKESHHAIH